LTTTSVSAAIPPVSVSAAGQQFSTGERQRSTTVTASRAAFLRAILRRSSTRRKLPLIVRSRRQR